MINILRLGFLVLIYTVIYNNLHLHRNESWCKGQPEREAVKLTPISKQID
jgi:hypothetical protein